MTKDFKQTSPSFNSTVATHGVVFQIAPYPLHSELILTRTIFSHWHKCIKAIEVRIRPRLYLKISLNQCYTVNDLIPDNDPVPVLARQSLQHCYAC
jgi:hypothetical protein